MDHFLPFYPPPPPPSPPRKKKTLKNQNFGKMKKHVRDIIILHMCTKNKNHMRYSSSDMEWEGQNFFQFVSFLPSHPLTNWKTKTLKKMKKASRDVIILHMCTKNHNHMYASWDMNCTRHNFLSFCTICCPFPPLTTWKIEISKKWEKKLEISSFYNCVPQITIIWCS